MNKKTETAPATCVVEGCCQPRANGVRRCNAHDYQRKKERDPGLYTYLRLKSNSKRRGKEMEVTLEQFRQFCVATEYLGRKGINADSLSIDRIDNTKGYTMDNIRVISVSENARKGTRTLDYYWDEETRKMVFRYKRIDFNEPTLGAPW